MRKVFGVGWAKTGTTTLGRSFEILGLDHQGARLDLVDGIGRGDLSEVMAVARRSEAFEDWPWPILFRELDAAFSASLFILTIRSSERWIRSYQNMLAQQAEASSELTETRRVLYGLPFPNVTESQLVERYERHNADVARHFRARPGSLLTVNWEAGDGWAELCSFLELDFPDQSFPHSNRARYL
jgi:hypothetical protein